MLRSQGELISGDEFSHKLIHIKSDNKSGTGIPYTKAKCVFASKFVENECLWRFQKNHIEDLRAFIENSKNIAEMSQSNEETVTFENLVKEEFTNIKDVNIREKIYYQPVAKNYQSIDSYIHPNQLLQITIFDRHGVKQKKLKDEYKNILDHRNEIRLYFVVPEESFRTYKKQNYLDGFKKAENVSQWIQNIK
ncbi:13196_t:CDS:2, partial [Funneliformis geosporum]